MIDRSHLSQLLSDDLGIPEGEGNFPCSDDSLVTVASKSLRKSFLKKFVVGGTPTPEQCRAGEELFLHYNERCKGWALPQLSGVEAQILEDFRFQCAQLFHNKGMPLMDLTAISEYGNLGPGANIGAKSYNFYSKLFDSKLTMTSDHLLRLYRSAIFKHPSWANAEKARHTRYGERIVEGSSLFHVLKESARSRAAATEPTLNMFLQKALGAKIEQRILSVFDISLSRQPLINRLLARLGSEFENYGTIDLKSASDCIALLMCRWALSRDFLSWLELTRSPVTILPDGKTVTLGLMSSMGNGFTFPLQTALFACLVKACYNSKYIRTSSSGVLSKELYFGVFGDDIIVRKDCFDIVAHMLSILGFIVNDTKSFNTGPFRESCGGDFWHGHDVRGVYVESLDTQADLYSAINRLNRWSKRWNRPLDNTIAYLMKFVERPVRYVPLAESDVAGLKVDLATARELGKLHWNKDLQAYAYKAFVPVPFRVTLRQPYSEFENIDSSNFNLYYRSKKMSKRWVDSKGKYLEPVGYNPDGLLISALGGFIQHGTLTLREQRTKYKVVVRHTSSWDYENNAGALPQGSSWQAATDDLQE